MRPAARIVDHGTSRNIPRIASRIAPGSECGKRNLPRHGRVEAESTKFRCVGRELIERPVRGVCVHRPWQPMLKESAIASLLKVNARQGLLGSHFECICTWNAYRFCFATHLKVSALQSRIARHARIYKYSLRKRNGVTCAYACGTLKTPL